MAGRFAWHELMTTDTAAAMRFYGDVVGWTARDSGMPGMEYTLLHAGEAQVAGLMALTEEAKAAGAPPGWTGYVLVDDVDGSAAQAVALGGSVCMPPMDVPGVGRFAAVADPQGAVIALFRPEGGDAPPAAAPMAPGSVGWNELMAGDMPAAWPFYAAMFGWTKAETMDMGPMGAYQLFAAEGAVCGGMMTKPAEVPVPFWGYYFVVPDIDAAVARVSAGGGTVLNGPMEVPGGAWVIQGLDPQGAFFALVGMRAG
jgi:predicted enzyme related to lactoylglutathione lyase